MNPFVTLKGCKVELRLGGLPAALTGSVAGWGQDVFILYSGSRYTYIPFRHIERLAPAGHKDRAGMTNTEAAAGDEGAIHEKVTSLRKILTYARGLFSEVYFSSGRPIYGYVSSVMNDYFIFCSPVYHTVAVSLQHLKYISPCPATAAPYNLSPGQFTPRPSPVTLARTFEMQLRKLEGELIIFNLGMLPGETGVLATAGEQMLELTGEDGVSSYIPYEQIQSVHVP